jgi:hypothetical protein
MRIGKALLLAMTLTLGVSTAFAQSIDLTADAAGTVCEGAINAGVTSLYIIARPGGAVAAGISGAEFYVTGLPAAWFAIVTPNPLNTAALGSPFATVPPLRANIAFPSCMPPDGNGVVLLYSCVFFPNSAPADAYLSVVVADPPTNPSFTTPILTACDSPLFTAYAAAGGQFIMFPATRHCTVAVQNTTWSGVKSLYGN